MSVARTLDLWLKQLRILLESDTPKDEILDALPINKAVRNRQNLQLDLRRL